MQHPYLQLQPEYLQCLSVMKTTRRTPIEEGLHRIVERGLDDYRTLGERVRVPAGFLAVLDLREGDCNPRLGIGQGDPWNQVSRHVPRGKGPFSSWLEANVYYVNYDHLNDASAPWSYPYACWKGEAWNGFGPRNHGRHTGYLFSCTNIYDSEGGKYESDGVWNPGMKDSQPGIIPVLFELVAAYPDLGAVFGPVPVVGDTPPLAPMAAPAGLGGGHEDTIALQTALNRLLALDPPLIADGSYGRMTRNAVRAFQRAHGLPVDGIAGPVTLGAVQKSLVG